jgi:glucose-6-phosphate isomerase
MGEGLKYDDSLMRGYIDENDRRSIEEAVLKAHDMLETGNGPGNDYLGWMELPDSFDKAELQRIKDIASEFKSDRKVLIVIGIGGSYLGARAVIEALAPGLIGKKIFFAGINICSDYLRRMLATIGDRDVMVNVISKSGTTTEPAVSFRIIHEELKQRYSDDELRKRIICTTDPEKGALRSMAGKKGYRTFTIPPDVGGRFSVLTPVGLFPIACAGIDVDKLLEGASQQKTESSKALPHANPSYRYAGNRNLLYEKGKKIEIFSSFDSRLKYFAEWWKQLFGESEGKEQRGIFPASCIFSTDLHSMGQFIQQGQRNIFETFITVEEEARDPVVPLLEDDTDGLNYVSGKSLDNINKVAYKATRQAHYEGGVPNSTVFIPELSETSIGRLIYFFEKAVAVSGYTAGVNPFDQPGVESYKKKMFDLLGK